MKNIILFITSYTQDEKKPKAKKKLKIRKKLKKNNKSEKNSTRMPKPISPVGLCVKRSRSQPMSSSLNFRGEANITQC